MTELDLIRSFRSDVPAPSAAATARAERAWRRPPRGGRRPWLPRLVVAATLAAGLTALALALPSDRDARLGTGPASAAEALRRAAAVSTGGMTRPLRAGEYWYVRRRNAWPLHTDGYKVLLPEVREDWVGPDGARRWRTRPDGPPRFPRPRDRERWQAAGSPRLLGPSEQRVPARGKPSFYVGAEAVTYAGLLALPRDPKALYQRMHDAAVDCECGNGVDEETFVIAADLLRDNPIPYDLRAAILRASALIPGIVLVERAQDVTGRTGLGVAFDGAGGRQTLVFDRRTYELLGENDGIGGSAELESAIVGSFSERR
jgi:RNA polymerase sigma-70 factor (ECF subfamily)